MTYEGKYTFKPPLPCRDKKSLLRLLKQHDMKGLGGILRDEVIESVPHAERVLKVIIILSTLYCFNSISDPRSSGSSYFALFAFGK